MKKIYPLITILIVLLIAGCAQETKQNVSLTDDNFSKKQECFKYKETIEAELEKSLLNMVADKFFYSSKEDSCLYTYTMFGGTSQSEKESRGLKNILSNEVIFSMTFDRTSENYETRLNEFEAKVKSYE